MKITEIKQKVKEAMVDACDDMLNFTDKPSRKFNAEYLFTVNVAKSINKLNGPPADPYQIYIEKSTKSFARDCLLPVIYGKAMERGTTKFRRETPKIKRNGRIDIAVYVDVPNNHYIGEQPLCAIELKGFNPNRKLVIADLKRNLEFHRVTGNTGESVLAFSLFASLHSFNGNYSDEQVELNISLIKSSYHKWLSELGNIEDIKYEIEAFTVRKELIGRVLDEIEYSVLDTDARHHFVGVTVCFIPKESKASLPAYWLS